jgi:hypothetical protein
MDQIWTFILWARRLRLLGVIGLEEDPREWIRTFWGLNDFDGIDLEFSDLLKETQAAEQRVTEYFGTHGTLAGDKMDAEGC